MRARSVHATGLLVGSLSSRSLPAQLPEDPYAREGFYASAGVGYGQLRSTCDECLSSTVAGYTLYLAAGTTLGWRVRIGGEANVMLDASTGSSAGTSMDTKLGYLGASLAYYPFEWPGVWIKGSLGYVQGSSTATSAGGTHTLSQGGLAGLLGLGCDLELADRGVVLIPFVSYLTQITPGSIAVSGVGTLTNTSVTLFQFGLGVGYKH